MLNIENRVYGTNRATLYLDDQSILSNGQNRLASFREKFIASVYKLFQFKEFEGLYVKQDEAMNLNINVKKDASKVAY